MLGIVAHLCYVGRRYNPLLNCGGIGGSYTRDVDGEIRRKANQSVT